MPLRLNCRLLFFTGVIIFLLSGTMVAKIVLASHHKAQIAFTSGRDGNAEIYAMDADGKNQRRLTHHPAGDGLPSWSPDGQKIAFTGYGDEEWDFEIYVMDSDGKNRKRLTDSPASNLNPSWSPDSKRIAFESTRHGPTEIYVMNADGRKQERLTDNGIAGDDPSWSPDGQKIAYDSWSIEKPSEIHLITAEGEYLKRLSELHKKRDAHPDWFDPTGRAVSPASNQITIWGRLKQLVFKAR